MGVGLPKSSNLTSTINKKIIFPGAKKTYLEQYQFQKGIMVAQYVFDKKSVRTTNKIIMCEHDPQQVDFIKVSTDKSQQNPKKIIYFHGNAENIIESLQLVLPIFKQLQITTYVMEYPGYGTYKDIQGSIPERIKQDSLQFHELIKKQNKTQDDDIYIIGRSIGTGVASYLASKVKCDKLLLISPFDSIKAMANKMIGMNFLGHYEGLDNFLVKDQFDNLASISNFNGKLMVIHGEKDEVIDIFHAQNLFKQYHNSQNSIQNSLDSVFCTLPQRGHNDIDFSLDDSYLLGKIKEFFVGKQAKN